MTPPHSQRRGVIHLLSGQWAKYALQIASLIVLSRLVSPEDFGLLAMVTAVVGIATVLGDFGLSLAAIRAQSLSQAERSNLFWLNTFLGLLLAALCAALAPLLAVLYDDERVTLIALALAPTFLLNGMGVQFRVELNRRRQFGGLALSDVLAQLAGLIAGVAAGLMGFGYWALVAQSFVISLVSLLFAASLARWVPSWWAARTSVRGFLRFGYLTSAAQVVNYISSNLGPVMIGTVFGASQLGFFNRAFQLAALPVQQMASPLTRIALPYLAARVDDAEGFAVATRRALTALAYPLLAVLSLIAGLAQPLVVVLLGHDWAQAAPYVQVLALGGAFQALGYVYYWAMLASNRAGLLFLVELPGRILTVGLCFVAISVGPVWIAAAMSAGLISIWLLGTFVGCPRIGISPRRVLGAAVRPLAVFVLAGTASGLACQAMSDIGPAVQLLVAVAAWLAVCGLALLIIRAVREDLGALRLLASRGTNR